MAEGASDGCGSGHRRAVPLIEHKTTILWDHDGVLVHTEPWYYEATRRCLADFGLPLPLADYLQDMKTGGTAWERARQSGFTDQQIAAKRAQRDAMYQEFLRLEDIEIPNVINVLEDLSQRYQMAIVTTAKRQDFELIHAGRDIVSHMRFVLANGDYPRAKPAPDPYLAALDRFGVAADQALVVEDSERGLRAAVAAGIDCVVVRNPFIRGHDFRDAVCVIDRLEALPGLLC